jgi:hypothetical protein
MTNEELIAACEQRARDAALPTDSLTFQRRGNPEQALWQALANAMSRAKRASLPEWSRLMRVQVDALPRWMDTAHGALRNDTEGEFVRLEDVRALLDDSEDL